MPFSGIRATRRTFPEAVVAISLVVAASGPARATSRQGEAEVRLQDGKPCFALTEKEASRGPAIKLQSMALYDLSVQPVAKIWVVMLDQASLPPLSHERCFVYGEAPAGSTATAAAALQNGKVYEVFLNGRSSDASDPTHGYVSKFCLAGDASSGGWRVMPVEYGSRAWTEGVCR
jgi:hypothetical protein